MKHQQRGIGFRFSQSESSGGFIHLECELFCGAWMDMTRVYANGGCDYDLDRLKLIRNITGDVWYFYAPDNGRASLRWQSHYRGIDDHDVRFNGAEVGSYSEWYACQVSEAKFSDGSIGLISKLYKTHQKGERAWDDSPAEIVKTLEVMKARPIKYVNELGTYDWIENKDWDVEMLAPKSSKDRNGNCLC